MPDVHDPRLLRMQLHAQFAQDALRRCQGSPCLRGRLAGDYPVVRIPRELMSPAAHLPIKRRQGNIAEQGRKYAGYNCA